jgi:SAM-dependent methyltransferase
MGSQERELMNLPELQVRDERGRRRQARWQRLLVSLLLVALALASCGMQQPRRPLPTPTPDRIPRPVPTPYRGDPSIFDDPKRDRELQIEQTMDTLGIRPGVVVADIGAGGGYFTFHAARRVGERGLVYAVDIQPHMLDHLNRRAEREKVTNIRTVLGEEEDPKLPAKTVDVAMILKTYHEIASPVALLRRVREALKDDGRLAVIDEDKPELREQARRVLEQPGAALKTGKSGDHTIAREFVIAEARRAGFKLIAERELPGEQNYFLLFAPDPGQ